MSDYGLIEEGHPHPYTSTLKWYHSFGDFANLFKAFIGTNYLSLSFGFKQSGLVLGAIGLALVSLLTDHTCMLIVRCKHYVMDDMCAKYMEKLSREKNDNGDMAIEQTGFLRKRLEKNLQYADIGHVCYGTIGSFLVNLFVIITQIGFCIGYFIFVGNTLHHLLPASPWVAPEIIDSNHSVKLPNSNFTDSISHGIPPQQLLAPNETDIVQLSKSWLGANDEDRRDHRVQRDVNDLVTSTPWQGVSQTDTLVRHTSLSSLQRFMSGTESVNIVSGSNAISMREESYKDTSTTGKAPTGTLPVLALTTTTTSLEKTTKTTSKVAEKATTSTTAAKTTIATEEAAAKTTKITPTEVAAKTTTTTTTTPAPTEPAAKTTTTIKAAAKTTKTTTTGVAAKITTKPPTEAVAKTTTSRTTPQPSHQSTSTEVTVDLPDASPGAQYKEEENDEEFSTSPEQEKVLPLYALVLLPLPILILFTFFRHLRHMSMISILANAAVVIGFSSLLIYIMIDFHVSSTVSLAQWATLPVFIGQVVAAYEAIGTILPIESSMEGNRHKFGLLLHVTVVSFTLLIGTIAIMGYLCFGDEIQQIIAQNIPPDSPVILLIDATLIFGVLCTYPLQIYPVVEILEGLLFAEGRACGPLKRGLGSMDSSDDIVDESLLTSSEDDLDFSLPVAIVVPKSVPAWKRNLFRAFLATFTAAIAVLLRNVFAYTGALVGALGSCPLAFILPCVFHIKLRYSQMSRLTFLKDCAILTFGTVACVVSVAVSLQEIVVRL